MRSKTGAVGVGLVEIYDLSLTANSVLGNISTRGTVETGDNVMIGGFISGPMTKGSSTVLIRAIGPSLPVTGALQDPFLELHDANGTTLATNDNWKISDQMAQSQQTEIEATAIPPTNDLESAILYSPLPARTPRLSAGRTTRPAWRCSKSTHLQ